MKEGLVIGLGIMTVLATFLIWELFAGPAPVTIFKAPAQAPAPNPGGYGSTGSQIAKTANQAANVMNTVTGDIGQATGDIASVAGDINSLSNIFGGGGSSDESFESFENEREGSESYEYDMN